MKQLILLFLIAISFIACGGTNTSENNNSHYEENSVFDDNISVKFYGFSSPYLYYTTSTQFNKQPLDKNIIKVQKTDTITLHLGNSVISSFIPYEDISPLELFNTSDVNNTSMLNFLRFALALDNDNNSSNEINITNQNLTDFNKTLDFNNLETLENILLNISSNSLATEIEAKEYLKNIFNTISTNFIGIYEGTSILDNNLTGCEEFDSKKLFITIEDNLTINTTSDYNQNTKYPSYFLTHKKTTGFLDTLIDYTTIKGNFKNSNCNGTIIATKKSQEPQALLLKLSQTNNFNFSDIPANHYGIRKITILNDTNYETTLDITEENTGKIEFDILNNCENKLLIPNEICESYVKLYSNYNSSIASKINVTFSHHQLDDTLQNFTVEKPYSSQIGELKILGIDDFNIYINDLEPNKVSEPIKLILYNEKSSPLYIYKMSLTGDTENFKILDENTTCNDTLLLPGKTCQVSLQMIADKLDVKKSTNLHPISIITSDSDEEECISENHKAYLTIYSDSQVPILPITLYGYTSNYTTCSSCFIATATYGSLFHPYVKILREFRDNYLITNEVGQKFVSIYYTYSPAIAEYIKDNTLLRYIFIIILSPIVFIISYPLLTLILILLLTMIIKQLRQKETKI